MDKNIRVRGKISGDDDVEGHAHKRAAADAVKRVNTKARKRETGDDTEGHAHKRAAADAVKRVNTKARKRETDDDTEGHARKRAKANASPAKKR